MTAHTVNEVQWWEVGRRVHLPMTEISAIYKNAMYHTSVPMDIVVRVHVRDLRMFTFALFRFPLPVRKHGSSQHLIIETKINCDSDQNKIKKE